MIKCRMGLCGEGGAINLLLLFIYSRIKTEINYNNNYYTYFPRKIKYKSKSL